MRIRYTNKKMNEIKVILSTKKDCDFIWFLCEHECRGNFFEIDKGNRNTNLSFKFNKEVNLIHNVSELIRLLETEHVIKERRIKTISTLIDAGLYILGG
jgi:hypothetical protein